MKLPTLYTNASKIHQTETIVSLLKFLQLLRISAGYRKDFLHVRWHRIFLNCAKSYKCSVISAVL